MTKEVSIAANSILPAEETLRIFTVHPYLTSRRLHWSGIEAHRYRVPASDTPMHSFPQLAVFMSHVEKPVRSTLYLGGDKMSAQVTRHTVSIAPPGISFRSSCNRPRELTVFSLDPLMVAEIASVESRNGNSEILPQFAIRDPLVRELGIALDRELTSMHPSPRIYAESLAMALASHVFTNYANPMDPNPLVLTPITHQLRRSIEFMNDRSSQDLTLSEIAAAANMSKYHFAKSFREMMKIAPHQYLIKLRIEKARKLLLIDSLSVEEIANRVGYADKTHFAAQFQRIVGVTPHVYRLHI